MAFTVRRIRDRSTAHTRVSYFEHRVDAHAFFSPRPSRRARAALVVAMGGRVRRACDRASARDAMDADDAMGDAGDGDAGARGRAATTAPRGEGAGEIKSRDSTRLSLSLSPSTTRHSRDSRARD